MIKLLKPFFFIRHGQTDANVQGRMCGGDWDIGLNQYGQKQAQKLSALFFDATEELYKNNNIPSLNFEIFVSPMLRARQTAQMLNSTTNWPMFIEDGLREWRVGDWEFKLLQEVPDPFETDLDPPNGETRLIFRHRITETIEKILLKTTKVPIMVSHGCVAHELFKILELGSHEINNCTVCLIKPGANGLAVEFLL
ncbi:MAG: histidine phosphatase family protein [Gammaproteobacteria bacterium]